MKKAKTKPKARVVRKTAAPPPVAKYLTTLGPVLAAQNLRTAETLKAAGVTLPANILKRIEGTPYPFARGQDATKMAKMGEAIAGSESLPPIVWPDMKKLDEEIKAARGPMTPEVKARLSALPRVKKHNGDAVALMLTGCKTLDDVFKLGAKHFKTTVPALKKKYAHLNNGQQRMVIGNRLRAMWKKGQLTKEAA